ncbi:hypothetical protein LTR02_008154 [Friedmanniomyces endolithicus]|nr:hypothetical protein LTR94_010704 [Friedmanniomyces endolithicus]KAK0805453.1 hypothetical protein LTR59_004007 [Friedmanniomyces endolithicus]KAK0811252.1 hypothetical protein LTR75_005340 [Friedmanniomyces endolithicus]KAK0861671.1 hypothetical protein LTS02_007680 [Friedmanniomyces endolithicus]KAK0902293.1 hypothetical protein LTR02_008154 [Friedmanniomyces endolithicus]
MATPYDSVDTTRDSNFASIRDSLYLLVSLNQYSISRTALETNSSDSKPAEGLLRVALFSKDLRLLKRSEAVHELQHQQPVVQTSGVDAHGRAQQVHITIPANAGTNLEPPNELNSMRQELAQDLRESRRKGVVPVFLSTLWFLFALAISIQGAFGYIVPADYENQQWLPIVVLCSIVDRNPASADDIRKKLNRLIDHVRKSLMDDQIRAAFVNTIDDVAERTEMQWRIDDIGLHCKAMGDTPFFESFSGQGRVKWHYGAAHAILCDVEEIYVGPEGRNWLHNEGRARTYLVLGKPSGGLEWFDYRELVQVMAAFICVGGTCFAAWVLSYFTPTVGLGCRSGGYTVFMAVATILLIMEMGIWWWMDAKKDHLHHLQRRATLINTHIGSHRLQTAWANISNGLRRLAGLCFVVFVTTISAILPRMVIAAVKRKQQRFGDWFASLRAQQRWDYCFFRPVEIGNTIWLLYRIMAQTFGSDETCACMSSLWAGGGGYVNMQFWNVATSDDIRRYWVAGTTLGVTVMSAAMIYIVTEW